MDFNELFKLIEKWVNKNKIFRSNIEKYNFNNNNDYFIYDYSIYNNNCSIQGQEMLAFFESIFLPSTISE